MKTVKFIILLALVFGGIALVCHSDKSSQHEEVSYGESDNQIRQTEESNNPSPYAAFGDSSFVLMTEHERTGNHVLEIPAVESLKNISKLTINFKTAKLKIYNLNKQIIKEITLPPDAIARFISIDPHAEKYVAWSPYCYVLNNPTLLTDPTGADPVFDNDGNFLGHYNDSDFEGEIVIMPSDVYNNITQGNDVVISPELAGEHGIYLKDYFSNYKEGQVAAQSDLDMLSNLYTNLLVEADKEGMIDFNPNDLHSGAIVTVGGLEGYASPNNSVLEYYTNSIANTWERGDKFDVSTSIRYYDAKRKATKPHVNKFLTHAGNAISILGVHEHELHGKRGWFGNHNHNKIYPIQFERSKSYISPEYYNLLKERAGK